MPLQIITHIVNSKPIRFLISLSKRIVIPGFDKIPLFDVASFFVKGLSNTSITLRASAIAFNLFMALFPSIIFLFTLIAYIPIDNFQNILINNILNLLPDNAQSMIYSTIEDIINRQRGGLLSLGFILALVFSSNGIMSLMAGFNNTYHAIETRSIVWQYIISFFLVIILSLFVILSVLLIIFGSDVLNYLFELFSINSIFTLKLLQLSKWIVIVLSLFFAISLIFYVAPSKKTRFRFISAGSTLTTLLFIVSSMAFNYYINFFGQYNKLYGSIGTLLIVMFWIYINAIVMLIGFELNASISQARITNTKTLLPK